MLSLFGRYPPFFDERPFIIYEKILAGKIDWPKHMDPVARYYNLLLRVEEFSLDSVYSVFGRRARI